LRRHKRPPPTRHHLLADSAETESSNLDTLENVTIYVYQNPTGGMHLDPSPGAQVLAGHLSDGYQVRTVAGRDRRIVGPDGCRITAEQAIAQGILRV